MATVWYTRGHLVKLHGSELVSRVTLGLGIVPSGRSTRRGRVRICILFVSVGVHVVAVIVGFIVGIVGTTLRSAGPLHPGPSEGVCGARDNCTKSMDTGLRISTKQLSTHGISTPCIYRFEDRATPTKLCWIQALWLVKIGSGCHVRAAQPAPTQG